MTVGFQCDRCATFYDDLDSRSTLTITVEATGRRKGPGEKSELDLCPACATTLVNDFFELDQESNSGVEVPAE